MMMLARLVLLNIWHGIRSWTRQPPPIEDECAEDDDMKAILSNVLQEYSCCTIAVCNFVYMTCTRLTFARVHRRVPVPVATTVEEDF